MPTPPSQVTGYGASGTAQYSSGFAIVPSDPGEELVIAMLSADMTTGLVPIRVAVLAVSQRGMVIEVPRVTLYVGSATTPLLQSCRLR